MPPNSFPTIPPSPPGLFSPNGPTETFNPPPNPTTSQYKLTHSALRIRNPAASLHFYVDLLGMRVIFSMNAGPFTIYYLGHPPPEATDLRSWAEESAQIPVLMQRGGLLELVHVHGIENEGEDEGGIANGNVPPHLGFAHLGFSVPDVRDAVGRLREDGVRVLKEVGVCSRETVPLSEWEEGRGVGVGEIHGNYAWFFEKFAMVADPDGYMVELTPQSV